MDPMSFALQQQIQMLKQKVLGLQLPAGAVIDTLSPATAAGDPPGLIRMDGSIPTLDRNVLPDLDALLGLQSALMDVTSIADIASGHSLCWNGYGFSTSDGGVYWWNTEDNPPHIVYEQVVASGLGAVVLATTNLSVDRLESQQFALVGRDAEGEVWLEFWRTYGDGNQWEEVEDIFPLLKSQYSLYSQKDNDAWLSPGHYVASSANWGWTIYIAVNNTLRDYGEIYAWDCGGDIQRVAGYDPDRVNGFVSPVGGVLSVTTADGPALAEMNSVSAGGGVLPPYPLRAYTGTPATGTFVPGLVPFYPDMVMLNSSGWPLVAASAQSGGLFVPPPYSVAQGTWSRPDKGRNVLKQADLLTRVALNAAYAGATNVGISGVSWNCTPESDPDKVFHLVGSAVKTPETGDGTCACLLVSWGWRNWHPVTHTLWAGVGTAISSGMRIQDSRYPDDDSFLMVVTGNAEGTPWAKLAKIRLNHTTGSKLTVPVSAAPSGMTRYLYPGQPLLPTHPADGGEGV